MDLLTNPLDNRLKGFADPKTGAFQKIQSFGLAGTVGDPHSQQ
jgi:hypothetical protein